MIRKILLCIAALLAFEGTGYAQTQTPSNNDLRVDISNGLFGINTWYIIPPKDGTLGIFMFGQDPTSGAPVGRLVPQARKFGSSIVCGTTNNSTCDVVFPPSSSFDGKYTSLTDVPMTFVPAPHTTALLTDMTSAGRAIAQASDASAMRSLLGVQSASEAAAAFYPLSSNPSGYLQSSALTPYLTSSAAASAYYPLSGNPSGFLTSITNAQVLAALGFTPYNAANPSSYINLAASRAGFSVTVSGSAAPSYNNATGVLTLPVSTPVVINRATITTATDGTYTWTFPTACSAAPVVQVTPQNSTANTIVNHKITAVSATSVTVATSTALLSLNAILSITIPVIQTASAQTLHLLAICP